jgi:hypothetical protein
MLQPLYDDDMDVPLAMTAKLLEKVLSKPVEEQIDVLRFSFTMLLVYLFQEDSDVLFNTLDMNTFTHNMFLKSMAAPEPTLFTVWKNVLRLRPTSDVMDTTSFSVKEANGVQARVQNNISLLANASFLTQQYMDLPDIPVPRWGEERYLQYIIKQEATPFSVLLSGSKFKSWMALDAKWKPSLLGNNSVLHDTVLDFKTQPLLLGWSQRVNGEKWLHQKLSELYELYGFSSEETKQNGITRAPLLSNQSVYVGPDTFDSESANNCFLNSALVALFMFPSDYVLKQLYKTLVQKVHIVDTSSQLCYLEDRAIAEEDRKKVFTFFNKKKPLTLELVRKWDHYVSQDFQKKLEAANLFRTCFEVFQKGEPPNPIRQKIRTLLTQCQSLVSGEMKENSFGEPDVVFELFQEVFLPPANFMQIETVCSGPNTRSLVTNVIDYNYLRGLSLPVSVPEAINQKPGGTLLTYFYSTKNEVLIEAEPTWTCGQAEKVYTQKGIEIKKVSGDFFVFNVSRKKYMGFDDSVQNDDNVLDDSKRVIPDPFFKLTNGTNLPLRAVIVTQGGYHYVCYVLNTFTDRWMYFNGGLLHEIGGYQQLLEHNSEEVVYKGTAYMYG